jgi:hypothetical protein
VPSRVAWGPGRRGRLLRAIGTAEATPRSGMPANRLAPAVAAAHRELDNVAARRGRELSIEPTPNASRRSPVRRSTTRPRWPRSIIVAAARTRGGAGPC